MSGGSVAPRPASGDTNVITFGAHRAVVGRVAAVLREYTVDGERVTESWSDEVVPPMGAGIVMAPWPNRIEDGSWTAPDGSHQQLDITEVARNCAIHGLLRWTAYDVVEHTESSILLSAELHPQHGYPFSLDVTVRYTVSANGLRVDHGVVNRGTGPAPFGVGAHPYFRLGERSIADLTLTISARTHAFIDDRWIPQGLAPVGEHGPDLRSGQRLGDVNCDISLTDFAVVESPAGPRHEHVLSAADGASVTVWTDPAFRWAQLYTPPKFPGYGPDQRLAIAIEPMTCNANAFRTGDDVLVVDPGESWSAAWGITPAL
ncbi:aldose 1-epimerase family protein [Nakamurella sp. A5-74]|uniref:Aldose 1-epimerase family protein n=1 Tax=Nakamurella sp. A5-74 TaxID=3158264 RepID=A0AAU8DLN6_9ACTN